MCTAQNCKQFVSTHSFAWVRPLDAFNADQHHDGINLGDCDRMQSNAIGKRLLNARTCTLSAWSEMAVLPLIKSDLRLLHGATFRQSVLLKAVNIGLTWLRFLSSILSNRWFGQDDTDIRQSAVCIWASGYSACLFLLSEFNWKWRNFSLTLLISLENFKNNSFTCFSETFSETFSTFDFRADSARLAWHFGLQIAAIVLTIQVGQTSSVSLADFLN